MFRLVYDYFLKKKCKSIHVHELSVACCIINFTENTRYISEHILWRDSNARDNNCLRVSFWENTNINRVISYTVI